MPFKSKAQARYLFAKEPTVAKEFASKTPSIKALPQHVKKKKKRKSPSTLKAIFDRPAHKLRSDDEKSLMGYTSNG